MLSANEAAVIAGIVVGSLALAGMVVVIGFQISLISECQLIYITLCAYLSSLIEHSVGIEDIVNFA